MRGKIKKKVNHYQRNKQGSADSKKSASPSSSSQKDNKNISLFKIQNIERLRKLQRLSLSKEILERMVQKRSLDIIKQRNTSQKRHVKRSFIDYTFNPLAVEEHNHFLKNNRQKQRKVSLIEALSQLKGEKQKSCWAFQKLRERTEGRIDNALNYKYNLQKDIIFSSKTIANNQNHQATKSSAIRQRQILHKSFLDLDKIIVINDNKVRITNKQEINIFEVLFKKRSQIFIQIDSLLLKHNFYFQSVLYGLAKQTKINPYKDISIYNRYFITNQPAKIPQMHKLTPINMFIVLPRLNSNDLLLIASGKLSPPILTQYVNLHVQQNNDNEQQRYLLKQNQLKNQKNNPIFTNRVEAQVSAQLSLSAAEKEWKIPTNSKFQYLQQLEELIASERVRSELQIKDRQLRVQMKDKKQCFLIELLNSNSPNKYKNVSNKIMLSKINKDCFQSSRNTAVNQIFKRYKDQLLCDIQQNRKKSIDAKYRRKNITESNSPIIKGRKLSADNEVRRKSSIKANKSIAYYD